MKLAFAIPNVGPTQLNFFLVMQANAFLKDRLGTDIVLFFETIAKPTLAMNTAAMHIAEGWGYDGTVVATSVTTAEKIVRFPSAAKRMFYCWDLEYLRPQRKTYRYFQAIYAHPDLELFARSQDHADALSKAWNKPVTVVPEESMVEDFLKRA